MSLAVGYSTQFYDLKRYMIIGNGSTSRPYTSFYSMYNDPNQAQYTAMAWLISGFSTRVIDLLLGQPGSNTSAPTLVTTFTNLASVTDQFSTVVKYCEQLVPPEIPWPLDATDFQTWLYNFSQGTATWTGATPDTSGVVIAQEKKPVSPAVAKIMEENRLKDLQPPTVGVQHIQGLGGTFCGCKGHVEPNWPFMKPLSRSEAYCPDCVAQMMRYHAECSRGVNRERARHEAQHRQPLHANPFREMPPLWEPEPQVEDKLPQAEPVN